MRSVVLTMAPELHCPPQMNASRLLPCLGLVAMLAGDVAAQQPTAPPVPQRRAQPRPVTYQVVVRDRSGRPIEGVVIAITGPAIQHVTTGVDGMASLAPMAAGTYRLRFQRDGFITLEREATVRAGQPLMLDVSLGAAPPPPAPPEPPPPPPPVTPPPAAPSGVAAAPSGPATFVSIPAFIDKNYIGREPLKESVLGCLADSTTRLLQLHDSIGEHTHADMDEILYVVAGEGAVRARANTSPIAAGALSIIPHGQPHAIERRGKNPLMVISILSGAPCRADQQAGPPRTADRRLP